MPVEANDKAIELHPTFAKAWHNKGDALDAQGKYNEAIRSPRSRGMDGQDWHMRGSEEALYSIYRV